MKIKLFFETIGSILFFDKTARKRAAQNYDIHKAETREITPLKLNSNKSTPNNRTQTICLALCFVFVFSGCALLNDFNVSALIKETQETQDQIHQELESTPSIAPVSIPSTVSTPTTLTDVQKIQSAIWGSSDHQTNFDIDTRVWLEVSNVDIAKETALFKHNAFDFWPREKPVNGKNRASFILTALLEYEPGKWYVISFEAISEGKVKNIGRVLRGGPKPGNPKYAVKPGQLVGFWIRPAFAIENGMSPLTWIKLK